MSIRNISIRNRSPLSFIKYEFRINNLYVVNECFGSRSFVAEIYKELELEHRDRLKGTEVNRLTGWYVKKPCTCTYKYSGISVTAKDVETLPFFLKLWELVELVTGLKFKIASLSLGDVRNFVVHHIQSGVEVHTTGDEFDILVMTKKFQWEWLHAIAQIEKEIGARLNFTFRDIVHHNPSCPCCSR